MQSRRGRMEVFLDRSFEGFDEASWIRATAVVRLDGDARGLVTPPVKRSSIPTSMLVASVAAGAAVTFHAGSLVPSSEAVAPVASLARLELSREPTGVAFGDRERASEVTHARDVGLVSSADGDLRGANLAGADLRKEHLSGRDLTEADLSGAVLAGSDLARAVLAGADLSGADLTGADLSEAILVEADLRGAEVAGATFAGADLSGVDLSTVIGLDSSDLGGSDTPAPVLGVAGAHLSTGRAEPGSVELDAGENPELAGASWARS